MGYYGNGRRSNPNAPITAPQLRLLQRLMVERELDPMLKGALEGQVESLTKSRASAFIKLLGDAPRREGAEHEMVTEPGRYQHPDGSICVVTRTRDGQRCYAGYEGGEKYVSGLIMDLTPDMLITNGQSSQAERIAQLERQLAEAKARA